MSLFSLDNILLKEDASDVININNIGIVDDNIAQYSFVREGYSFILDMMKSYHDADKEFYKNILESYDNSDVITESFSDFFNKIKDIIKKFIEWVKKVFKEFSIKLHSLFRSESYLKKKKNEFAKFSYEDEFEFNGYKFTHINEPNIPLAAAYDFINADGENKYFNTYQTKLDTISRTDDITKISDETKRNAEITKRLNKELDTINDEFVDSLDDKYDVFRGIVIGQQTPIDSSDYANELFEFFRDGYDSPSSITIDSNFVMEANMRFNAYDKTIKTAEKTKNEIIKDYEKLENALNKLLSKKSDTKELSGGVKKTVYSYDITNTASNTYASSVISKITKDEDSSKRELIDQSTYDKMDQYIKHLSAAVTTVCSIHTQALSAKLQAEKDCFIQDKKILYKALAKIEKHKNP